MIPLQNQLQRLRTEEVLRQQSSLKRSMEGEEEEEEEDESSNSTTSSPCLRHKDQQNSRYNSTNENVINYYFEGEKLKSAFVNVI